MGDFLCFLLVSCFLGLEFDFTWLVFGRRGEGVLSDFSYGAAKRALKVLSGGFTERSRLSGLGGDSTSIPTPSAHKGRYNLPADYIRNSVLVLLSSTEAATRASRHDAGSVLNWSKYSFGSLHGASDELGPKRKPKNNS